MSGPHEKALCLWRSRRIRFLQTFIVKCATRECGSCESKTPYSTRLFRHTRGEPAEELGAPNLARSLCPIGCGALAFLVASTQASEIRAMALARVRVGASDSGRAAVLSYLLGGVVAAAHTLAGRPGGALWVAAHTA